MRPTLINLLQGRPFILRRLPDARYTAEIGRAGDLPWVRTFTSRPGVFCAGNAAFNFLLQSPCYTSMLDLFLVMGYPVPRSYSARTRIMIVSQLYQEWRRFQPFGNRA